MGVKKRPQVVILGGGFAGLMTARHLVRAAAVERECDVTVIDKSSAHTYTPWLYEAATGALREDEPTLRQAMLASAGVEYASMPGYTGVRFVKAQIEGLDLDAKHVRLAGKRQLPYDVLVVALGAEPNYFNVSGLPEHALVLKELIDAEKIQRAISELCAQASARKPKYILVAGAGPNGIEFVAELANTLRILERRGKLQFGAIKVTLLDPATELFGILPPSLRARAVKRLESLGVTLATGLRVTEVGAGFVKAFTASGRAEGVVTIPTDLCIWSAGVRVNSLLSTLPFKLNDKGRVMVDSTYLVSDQSNVFAAGDCAALVNPRTGRPDPQSAQVAHYQAHDLAKNILRYLRGQAMRPAHLPGRWAFFSALGGRYAVGTLGGFKFSGYPAFVLRRVSDLYYFLFAFPVLRALRQWLKGVNLYRKNDG